MPNTVRRTGATLVAACLLPTTWLVATPRPAVPLDPFTGNLVAHFPGYYLRHVDYDFVLAANDNGTAFRADATFRIAG